MTIPVNISIVNGSLQVQGRTLLSRVPGNVSLTFGPELGVTDGAFLGAASSEMKSHHVFPLGVLEGLRFLCCFRFKLWWMTQRMGNSGKDIPLETQFLVVETKNGSGEGEELDLDADFAEETTYTVFLPILEGPFRASLQGNEQNEMELCLESGDPAVQTSQSLHSVFVFVGDDPFQVISDAVRTVEKHLGTFQHSEKKKMPRFLDWFGWCTWDAFYTNVTADGIRKGLDGLIRGGTPPRFLIIDDGWQSVATDQQPVTASVSNGDAFESRLTHIKENYKFQKDGNSYQREEDPKLGLHHVIDEIKSKYQLKYVYVWHALTGYWGGVKPGVLGMEHYESALKYPVPSLGVIGNELDYALDIISTRGLGLVHPNKVFHFYNELHSYLAAAGVDGVKVDGQNILETLGEGLGGRVSLTRQYHQALETSIAQNFPDNGCISCMSHNTDALYSSKQTAVVRASEDFFPSDPASHTIHVASVAYNSFFLGEFMQPDWDMFHSLHPAAEYHAAARAIGGCAIYVSDKPGNHDFHVLRKLVLPDGSVLRAQLPGRPSQDCLFTDPTRDGKSLLKIWNMNKHTGVLGVFNCQGAGWCRKGKKNMIHNEEPSTITSSVHARDVHLLSNIVPCDWNGDCVAYSHRGGELVYLPKSSTLPVTLKPREYEVFVVTPVKYLTPTISFAPIGLITMLNAGGAIQSLEYEVGSMIQEHEILDKPSDELSYLACQVPSSIEPCFGLARMKVRGCGQFGVYSSSKPKIFRVDSQSMDFLYDADNGLATVLLPIPEKEGYVWDIQVEI
eukprot:c8845_g1_i1 orf=375-2744(-)